MNVSDCGVGAFQEEYLKLILRLNSIDPNWYEKYQFNTLNQEEAFTVISEVLGEEEFVRWVEGLEERGILDD